MTTVELMRQVHELGGVLTEPQPGRLHVSALGPLPGHLVDALREHKPQIIAALQRDTSMIGFPFPIGYGGLPLSEVEAAEAFMDKQGVIDPVLRKYNVVSWVRSFYQDRGENRGSLFNAICAEQQRLGGILDHDKQCKHKRKQWTKAMAAWPKRKSFRSSSGDQGSG